MSHPGPQPQLQQEHHDVVCVGFGLAAMSLGIALRESNSSASVTFLEEEAQSAWRPLGDLPGTVHMSSNFLYDMITLENPRSDFTFIRFLHGKKWLVDFTNLSSMQPPRVQFEEYLKWCAKQFKDEVRHDTKILSIEPVYSGNKKINSWNVFSLNRATGQRHIHTAEKVVICVDRQPYVPGILAKPELKPAVIHSSRCMTRLNELTNPSAPHVRIAIVGQTQQAAELFDELYDVRADRQVIWLVEDGSLQQEAQTSMTASLVPSSTTVTDRVPPELRFPHQSTNKPSSKPINKALLDRVYETQYAQKVKEPDSTKWKFQIKFNQVVTGAEKTSSGQIHLTTRDVAMGGQYAGEFDLVIAATGFVRSSTDTLLSSIISKRLLDGPSMTTDGDYAVNLRRGVLDPGVGLWCIGLIGEMETAVGEGSFKIMAERSARVARSITEAEMAKGKEDANHNKSSTVQAQL
ncbi:hypothetical protein PMZ80_011079 [Knufia obscura]|uniref:L-ornithine N(5)-monooxygenase n=2 Tax=Knufia TaxID=430999 RepID=A0AAN8I297_9EURO|nr:hypothetical protein PMZ80_011079 [Knufia obscura]KAK5948229.1 hypothetical protein OHC33_010777 [Knufia fluminis]